MRNCVLVMVPLLLMWTASSFTASTQVDVKVKQLSASRRSCLELPLIALTTGPLVARADISEVVASSSALRKVKAAQKRLSSLEDNVNLEDYQGIREAFRSAPIGSVRQAASGLVKATDSEDLGKLYQDFIGSLEKMDSLASLAQRGRTLGESEFIQSYQKLVASLGEFTTLADRLVPSTTED